MKTAVLIMKRVSLAQGLMEKAASSSDLRLVYETDYTRAEQMIRRHDAYAVLLEITESNACSSSYCLNLCAWLRTAVPQCKLLLMCPETNEDAVRTVIQAKRNGRIDDFVFYDASMKYLLTLLRAAAPKP